jgi:hypothetical protein
MLPRRLMIRLRKVDRAAGEQRLVRPADLAVSREDQHPGGQPIQSVGGAQLGQSELSAKPHQRRLRDVTSPRHGGQEVWFVDNDEVMVLVQHRDVERHRHLVR